MPVKKAQLSNKPFDFCCSCFMFFLLLVFCRRLLKKKQNASSFAKESFSCCQQKASIFPLWYAFQAKCTNIDGVKSLFSAIFLGLLSLMQGTLSFVSRPYGCLKKNFPQSSVSHSQFMMVASTCDKWHSFYTQAISNKK